MSSFVKVMDKNINYIRQGNGQVKVLFLHGKRFTLDDWIKSGVLSHVAEAGFEAVAVDLPGFGESEIVDLGYPQFLSEFLDLLNLEQVVLVGPSMSGKIAISFALNYPNLVKALILIAPVDVHEFVVRLPDLDKPTLVIWGDQDQVAPFADGELLTEKLPNAELYTFKGEGHTCYFDQVEKFKEIVVKYLMEMKNPG